MDITKYTILVEPVDRVVCMLLSSSFFLFCMIHGVFRFVCVCVCAQHIYRYLYPNFRKHSVAFSMFNRDCIAPYKHRVDRPLPKDCKQYDLIDVYDNRTQSWRCAEIAIDRIFEFSKTRVLFLDDYRSGSASALLMPLVFYSKLMVCCGYGCLENSGTQTIVLRMDFH